MALWLFHNIIKVPIVGLLPASVQMRLPDQRAEFRFGGLRRFLAILGSIAFGIATHIVWDSFTHRYTWPYDHWSWLRGKIYIPFIGDMPIELPRSIPAR